jgi:hypothetical protein
MPDRLNSIYLDFSLIGRSGPKPPISRYHPIIAKFPQSDPLIGRSGLIDLKKADRSITCQTEFGELSSFSFFPISYSMIDRSGSDP